MKIKSINTYIKDLELIKPYTIAFKTISAVENVFVEIELENGIIGLGATNPSPDVVGENPVQTLENYQDQFFQELIGRDIRHFQQIIYELREKYPNLPGTQAGVDIALHDAFCQFLEIPIVSFYGEKIKKLPTSVTIGIMEIENALEEARAFSKAGFKILKIKTGSNVDQDIERVIKLHEQFGGKMKIRVDANQGYNLIDLRKFIHATTDLSLDLIEQPMPTGKEIDQLELHEEERNKLAADESLKDAKYALKWAQSPKPFGIFNIKLMKCGGIFGAQQIATIAEQASIDLFWGCNDESIISITAALHIAFANKKTKYIDLDGSLDLAVDIVSGGFTIEDGFMRLNGKPGLGVNKL